jgi:hypothetical protein
MLFLHFGHCVFLMMGKHLSGTLDDLTNEEYHYY